MGKLGLNQLAAMNMVYNRYSFTYFLDSLERMGVKQFELWAGAPHFCNFIQSLSDAGKLRKEVEARGLKIVCLTPEQVLYPHNIASSDKELRQFSLEYFYKYIGQTAELGADKMLCCAGWEIMTRTGRMRGNVPWKACGPWWSVQKRQESRWPLRYWADLRVTWSMTLRPPGA